MDFFITWLKSQDFGEVHVTLLIHVGVVLLAIIVFNFILRHVLARMEKVALQTNMIWDDALILAARRPASWLAWVVGLSFVAHIVKLETDIKLLDAVPIIRTIGVIVCFAWFLLRFINNMQRAFLKRQTERGETPDRTTVDAVGQILRIIVVVIAFLVGLQSLDFSISGVLAFGGIGGIAIGFAAKDLLANFFGGLMIHLDGPFAVGDWIRSSEKQIEGTVEAIGWKITCIRTFDKRPLYVPNSVFANITVENASRMTNRRINETIGVRYEDIKEVAGIVEDIRAMLLAHPEIDQSQATTVNFVRFNDFSLDILVDTFTRTTAKARFYEIKQEVLLKLAAIIAKHGADIAYPTRISYNGPIPSAQSDTKQIS
jgi:MscS family membrane protein